MQFTRLGSAVSGNLGSSFGKKNHLYATRQLTVALRLESVTYYPLSKIITLHP